MFEQIGVSRSYCTFCATYTLVGTPGFPTGRPLTVVNVCARCARAMWKVAALLDAIMRGRTAKGKAKTKKPRKLTRGQPSAIAPPSEPVEHGDDVLFGTRHG